MFGKKKVEVIVKQPTTFLSTLEVVKESTIKAESTYSADHIAKLENVQGVTAATLIEKAKLKGFNLFATPSIFSKFRYVASVDGEQIDLKNIVWIDDKYIGDIPDFALDRIQELKTIGFKYFTIHSNELMEVQALDKIDPVVIAWAHKRIGFRGGNPNTMLDTDCGVIVAMWDMDKEIEIA